MEIRSFLAFELPKEIKNTLARVSGEIRDAVPDVRRVKVDNIHLTVVFMGQVKTDLLTAIGEEVEKVCLRYGTFEVALNGMGCFPNRRNPRVLWIGLQGDLDRMARFRDAVQHDLVPFGIKEEKRPFSPHLTLGRFRKGPGGPSQLGRLMGSHEGLSSPVFPLNELILFRSDLKPTGAQYTKLRSWPLTGNG